jgi:hypothetical protein
MPPTLKVPAVHLYQFKIEVPPGPEIQKIKNNFSESLKKEAGGDEKDVFFLLDLI